MKAWPQIQVHDRWHALHVANVWPTHILAVVDDADDAATSSRREVTTHVEVFGDIVDPTSSDAPTHEHVRRIIDLARTLNPTDRLLVHCAAGIGRSPAASLCVWSALGRDPSSAFRSLLRIRPQADPNPLILMHADDLLYPRTQRLFDTWWEWVSQGRSLVPPSDRHREHPHRSWATRLDLIERSLFC